jgi:hypothetical protein
LKFILFVFFSTSLFSENLDEILGLDTIKTVEIHENIDEVEIKGKDIYTGYHQIPQKVYMGQIFPITLKTRVLSEEYDKLRYKFFDTEGLISLNNEPHREMIDEGGILSAYDTFYFKVTDTYVSTPRINLYLSKTEAYSASLSGRKIHSIHLPCEMIENCSGIFAENLTIDKTLANRYDEENNILTIFISAEKSDLKGIHFKEPYIKEQGYETENSSKAFLKSRAVYYIVVPKYYNSFKMKYFNTVKFQLEEKIMEIDVRDDMVTTAKDLRPKILDHNRNIKYIIAIITFAGFIALFYFFRRNIFIILSFFPLGFLIILSIPKQSVCIKGGTVIKIIPMSYSTNFKEIEERTIFEKVAERDNFIKISLSENSEGWVRRESVCEED